MMLALAYCLFCSSVFSSDAYFNLQQTLRIDFVLKGNFEYQSAQIVKFSKYEGWSGSANQLISPFNFGEYRILIIHPATFDTLYLKGFSTLFEEWRTIEEARTSYRTFQNTVLTPFPDIPVIVSIDGRERNGTFTNLVYETLTCELLDIGVEDFVDYPSRIVYGDDEPAHRMDFLFLAEGYTSDETEKFFNDASRMSVELFSVAPFNSYREMITIRAVALPSNQSGTDDPRADIWRDTWFNSSFNTFDIDRYLETEDTWKVYDAAALFPHDHIVLLVNNDKYGGGGIYNFFSISTSDNRFSDVVLIHEIAHGFAGLGDEYFDSDVSYADYINQEIEPWQANLTTLVDFSKKWKHLIEPGIPVPTPVDHLYMDKTGVFEGGGYVSKGVYRPAVFCRMRSSNADGFCEVCQEVIRQKIEFYAQ